MRSGRSLAYALPGKSEQDRHWSAIIVESVRVDGQPRQRHVAYLGGITDSAIKVETQRAWFWADVLKRLDGLANRVSEDDRKRIVTAVDNKVPRPTKKDHDRIARECRALKIEPPAVSAALIGIEPVMPHRLHSQGAGPGTLSPLSH